MKRLWAGLLLFSLMSCLKEEIPVTAPLPGDVKSDTVGMSSDYRYQVYYSLLTGAVVSKNLKKDWDIGFESSSEGNHIILNTSKLMYAARTTSTDFAEITDTAGGYSWNTDAITGNLDSTAIGEEESRNYIYILNRGLDENGTHQGFVKVLFVSSGTDSYNIHWAKLKETTFTEAVIPRIQDLNFVQFSFNGSGEVKLLEPDNRTWDLLFTQYSEKLDDGENLLPYLVTGVQINRKSTLAGKAKTEIFEDVNLDMAMSLKLNPNINQPGYDWKTFSLDEGTYVVDTKKIYIIRTQDLYYYKLRFTDFYNDKAEKGFPKFEYQKL